MLFDEELGKQVQVVAVGCEWTFDNDFVLAVRFLFRHALQLRESWVVHVFQR